VAVCDNHPAPPPLLQVRITYRGRQVSIGTFYNPLVAARIADAASINSRGWAAAESTLNVPTYMLVRGVVGQGGWGSLWLQRDGDRRRRRS